MLRNCLYSATCVVLERVISMHQTETIFQKFRLFLRLATPVILTQFSLLAGTFVAVFLTGQYSTVDLAGISIGYNIWVACFFGAMGILLGISPIIAQLLGAKRPEQIPTIVRQGLYLATCMGLFLLILGFLGLKPLLLLLNLEPQAYEVCIHYMTAIAFGILPLMWLSILRNTVDSHGYTHYSMGIMITSFFLSVLLNYVLINGHFGLPALGGVGAGIATAICCWFNLLCYLVIVTRCKAFKDYHFFKQLEPWQWPYIQEQLRLGVPIGISIFCEMSIFSVAGLVMAYFGTEIIAAHQAAISFTNLFYCFPLSLSIASTIAVGYEVGAQRYADAKAYAYIARGVSLVIAALISMYSFTHLSTIAGLYTTESHMVNLIGSFLSYAVFFTVIDAFGTPIQGILRGYKDVRIISVIAISTYWGVSVPVAYVFSKLLGYGPYGIWVGLLGSVSVAGILYTWRLWYIQYRRYAVR